MTETDRGLHPDLLDEIVTEREQAEPQEAPARRSRGHRAAPPTPAPTPEAPDSAAGSSFSADEPQAPTEPPEWLAQLDDIKDPVEKFKLLAKNLPREQLEKDETLSGFIGSRADLRARQILQQQEAQRAEQAKLEAAQNNDLYTLGELTQREYQDRIAQQQQAAQAGPIHGRCRIVPAAVA